MYPCGFLNAGKSPLLRYPMIYALHRLGLPYNRITKGGELVFSLEEFQERANASFETDGPIIFWDDAPFQFHKPTVWETWALLAWWDFQRWAF